MSQSPMHVELLQRHPRLWFLDLDSDKENLAVLLSSFIEVNPLAKFLLETLPEDDSLIRLITANPQRSGDQFYRYDVDSRIWTFKVNILTDRFSVDIKRLESQLFGVTVKHQLDLESIGPLLELVGDRISLISNGIAPKVLSVISNLIIAVRSREDQVVFLLGLTNLCLSLGLAQSLAMSAASTIAPHVASIYAWVTRMESQSAGILLDPSYIDMLMPIVSIISVLGCTFTSLKLPEQKFIDGILHRMSNFGRAAAGFSTIFSFLEAAFRKAFDYVLEQVTGLPSGALECSKYIQDVEKYFNEIHDVISRANYDKLTTDLALCDEINSLYQQGFTYHQHLSAMKLSRAQMEPFNMHFRELTKLFMAVIRSGARAFGPRSEPLVVHLFGDSGVGKSGVTFLLAQDLLVEEGLHHDVVKEMYMRQVEQEYWDGYHGQLICVYDDFGQMRDGSASPNMEYIEIIRTGNIVPMMCHMAAVEDKSRTPFTSKALILTSNLESYDINSLTYPDAFYRRRHVCAKVVTKTEFSKKSATGAPVIDPTKLVDKPALFDDLYEFRMYDPITRKETGQVLAYEEFAALCRKQYVVQHKRSQAIMDCLAERAFLRDEFVDTVEDNFVSQCSDQEFDEILCAIAALWFAAKTTDDDILLGDIPPILRPRQEILLAKARKSESFDEYYREMSVEVSTLLMGEESFSYSTRLKAFVKKYFHDSVSFAESCCSVGYHTAVNSVSILVNTLKKLSQKWIGMLQKTLTSLLETPMVKAAIEWFTLSNTMFAALGILASIGLFGWMRQKCERPPLNETFTEERANPRQRLRRRNVGESKASADEKTAARQRKQTEVSVKPELLTEACFDNTQRDIINHALMSNLYRVFFDNGDGLIPLVNCVFVQGSVALVPSHAIDFIKQHDFIVLRNPFNQTGLKISCDEISFYPINATDGEEKDATLMVVKSQTKKNILKHFVKRKDLSRIASVRASLLTLSEYKDGKVYPREFAALAVTARDRTKYTHRNPDSTEREILVRNTYHYDCETAKGDCGAPLVAANESLERKILGFHICGSHGVGVSVALSYEDIREALDTIPMVSQIGLEFGDDVDERCDIELPEGDFDPIGKLSVKLVTPSKTSLRESPLYGKIWEPITAPSALRSVMYEGERIFPLQHGLKKCGVPPMLIRDDFLEAAGYDMRSLIGRDTRDSVRRVLTHIESIQGIPGNDLIAPVNRRSSPGYPWNRSNKGIGKTMWLGEDEYIFDNVDLLAALNLREKNARQGIRTPTLWVDTLKDERRSLQKVEMGKTRVFSAGPMDYIILYRKYFLAFNAHVMKNMIQNEVAVGINVYSPSWGMLARYLQEKGKKVVAGDFSNFDGTLNDRVLDLILDIVNDWYDDGEENALIRSVLWKEIRCSIHICGDNVYAWNHSQPSGNPGTVIINSLYNSIVMRVVWSILTENTKYFGMREFRHHVNLVTYGDDNVLNISDEAIDFFNQTTIADTFPLIGMTYTNETKTANTVDHRPLSEISFLKRGFRWDDVRKLWRAPLQLDVVMEMCNWIRGTLGVEEATIMNCETAYMELALHDQGTFTNGTQIISRACVESLTEQPQLMSYKDYALVDYSKYFLF